MPASKHMHGGLERSYAYHIICMRDLDLRSSIDSGQDHMMTQVGLVANPANVGGGAENARILSEILNS